MGSNAKKKTTMAKLQRESRLRERRLEKKVKKNARKLAAAEETDRPSDPPIGEDPGADSAPVAIEPPQ